MSSPANIGIISDGQLQIYYDRHGGNSTPFLCLGGPYWIAESACKELSPSDGWLGEVYAEGGMLVDLDKRILLIHGSSEYFNELGFRRFFLSLLRDLNPSWTIKWAHGGQGDFLAHLGLDASLIVNALEPEPLAGVGTKEGPNPYAVCSVRTNLDLQLYAMDCFDALELCSMGVGLVDRLAELEATDSVVFDGSDIYAGGIHIDQTSRSLKIWSMEPIAALETRFSDAWPDWVVKSWGDSIEQHIVATNNRIGYSMASEVEHLKRMNILLEGPFMELIPDAAQCWTEIRQRITRFA